MKYFDQQPLRDVGDFPDFGAAQYGEKDAVHHGSDTLTWTGMREQSNRIGNRLAERLDESGTHIGICMENNSQYLPIFYGIIKSGAVPVPMNYRLDIHSLEHIVEDAGIECLFGSDSFADDIAALRDRSGVSEVIMVGDAELRNAVAYDDWLADSSSEYRQSWREFDDIAYMLYTSGTTSNPKGVPYTHGNCLHTLELNSQTGAGDPEEVVQLTIGPCFHVYGLIGSKSVLYDGGTVVMRNRPAPEVLLDAITEFGVTEMGGVPTIYVNMINEIEENPEQYDISSIRSLGTGAAPLANDTRDRIESAFGVILTEAWGMTETSVGIEEPVRGPRKGPGCIGYPLPGIEFKLVDPATRETRMPPAVLDPAAPASSTDYAPDFDDESTYTGEIATRGPNVFPDTTTSPRKTRRCSTRRGGSIRRTSLASTTTALCGWSTAQTTC